MYLDTLMSFELRHISEPFFIGFVSVKLTAQQVFGKILRILSLSGAAVVIVFHSRPYLSGPADPQHSLVIDMDAIIMVQIVIQSAVAFIWALHMDSTMPWRRISSRSSKQNVFTATNRPPSHRPVS